MTFNEAILKSLDDLKTLSTYSQIYEHILANNYRDFGKAKTPDATVSALLGEFIRKNDSRVKRIKIGGGYHYYLSKYEADLESSIQQAEFENTAIELEKELEPGLDVLPGKKKRTYLERSLHPLLSSYLNIEETFSKTIFHEHSRNRVDSNQTWTHPDMVGIKFLNLKSKTSQAFMKAVDRSQAFKLSSYELKREIQSDADLKKAFFQAFSNSSWANYGYLVTYEFNNRLTEELERLNQSFGIGVIELHSNPFRSKVLFPARYKDLDYKTIDKLCKMNADFAGFIEQVEKLITAQDRYYAASQKELEAFCDDYFTTDSEFEKHCKVSHIPKKD